MLLLCLIMKLSMISAEEILILKDQLILTWIDLLLKLFLHWLLLWDLTVLLTLMLQNSKPILYHTQEFILCCPLMPLLYLLKKLIMNNWLYRKSLPLHLNLSLWWLNVIQDMVNTWLVVLCTEEMLYQKMLMLLLLKLRLRELSNL